MSGQETKKLKAEDGDWPPVSVDKEFLRTDLIQDITIYYYPDPQTGEICTDRTIQALLLMSNVFRPLQDLSTYMSIMNVFTYPELQILSPKLPSLIGIRLRPIPMTDLAWLNEYRAYLSTPLPGEDKMVALAIFTLLLECKTSELLMDSAREVCAAIGVTNLKIGYAQLFEGWIPATAFFKCDFNTPLCKYIYDCLVRKAVAAKNKRAEQLLRLCGNKMPTVLSCKTTFNPPSVN